jgi:hypothetical protein
VEYKRTPHNTTVPTLGYSALGKSPTIMKTYGMVANVIFRFIPLVILIIVNVAITIAIRRTR